MIHLKEPKQFQWDAGNDRKNADKHGISKSDAEQAFFNQPLFLVEDKKHSQDEARFHALGKTNANKELHITFTIRDDFIRVISARPMSKKERKVYHEKANS